MLFVHTHLNNAWNNPSHSLTGTNDYHSETKLSIISLNLQTITLFSVIFSNELLAQIAYTNYRVNNTDGMDSDRFVYLNLPCVQCNWTFTALCTESRVSRLPGRSRLSCYMIPQNVHKSWMGGGGWQGNYWKPIDSWIVLLILDFERGRMMMLVELKQICAKLWKNSMLVNISSVMTACYPISEWEMPFHWEWMVRNSLKTMTLFAYFRQNQIISAQHLTKRWQKNCPDWQPVNVNKHSVT